MKSKSKILLCIGSIALYLTTNLTSLAMPPKRTTSTPGFALGQQVGDTTRACYKQLEASPCDETAIMRITKHFLDTLNSKIYDLSFFMEKDSPTIKMLHNRIARIQAIQKRLLDMLHGEWVNPAGMKTRKNPAEIRLYCIKQSKIPTRNKVEDVTLDGFIVFDDENDSEEDLASDSNKDASSSTDSSSSDEDKMTARKRPRRATVVKKTTIKVSHHTESSDDEEFKVVKRKKPNPMVLDESDSSDATKDDRSRTKRRLHHAEYSSDDESGESKELVGTTFFSFSYTETTTVRQLTPTEGKKSPKKNVKARKSRSSSSVETEFDRKDDKPKHSIKRKRSFLVDSDPSSDSDHTPETTIKSKKD